MPSKKKNRGSPVVSIRVPAELLAQVDEIIKESEATRFAQAWSRPEWIISAIKEKLAHRVRSKKSSAKRRALPVALGPAGDVVEQLPAGDVVEQLHQVEREVSP